MGVDETHLVGKAVPDAGDHVLDDGADGAEARDVLPGAVPDDELDLVDGGDGLVRRGEDADRHVEVLQVLLQRPARAGDGDDTGLDGNRDVLPRGIKFEVSGRVLGALMSGVDPRDLELLFLVDLLHLWARVGVSAPLCGAAPRVFRAQVVRPGGGGGGGALPGGAPSVRLQTNEDEDVGAGRAGARRELRCASPTGRRK